MQEVLNKIKEHDKKFEIIDKRFDEHDKRFDEIDKRFDQVDSQIDFLVRKSLNHEDRLDRIEENMATKDDIEKITNTLDKLVVLHEVRNQEVAILAHSLLVTKDKVEEHDRDIRMIKPILGMS
jgi:acetolactate synthase small subunit